MTWSISKKRIVSFVTCLSLAVAGLTAFKSLNAEAQTTVGQARINVGGVVNPTKRMYIHLDKATIVDLPVDAADVLVANAEIVDAVIKTSRQTYLLGKKVGQTNIFFFDAGGKQLLNLEVCVERDIRPLISAINKYLPDSKVKVQAMKDNIILSGNVATAAMADKARDLAYRFVENPENVVNMITIDGGEQVMLKVKVVEMQRSIAKQFGVNLGATLVDGNTTFSLVSNNPFSLTGRALNSSVLSVLDVDPGGDRYNGDFRALERTGLVRTLAEPNLTAISGESANFLAGGEFPVPVGRDRDGNVSIEFKPFGVGLAFTPVVLSEGRISLKISTEVSETSNDNSILANGGIAFDEDGNQIIVGGLNIPSLTVRRAETTLELPSGGSIVMAGLIKDQMKQSLDGIPGVKDLPVIGALARSRDFLSNQTELVVIVTPYLVGPTHESNLATPADKFAPPSDSDGNLLGRLNAVYGPGKDALGTKTLKGPVGFIVK